MPLYHKRHNEGLRETSSTYEGSKILAIKKNQEFFKSLPFSSKTDKIILWFFKGYELEITQSMLNAPNDVLYAITGGCGPGDFGDKFVPDTLWGLSVKSACVIHDWTFQVWNDDESFKVANDLFLRNMYTIIEQHGGFKWIQKLRRMRARKYHYFVSTKKGKKSYKDNHLEYII